MGEGVQPFTRLPDRVLESGSGPMPSPRVPRCSTRLALAPLFLILLLLGGCSGAPRRAVDSAWLVAQVEREQVLQGWRDWGFSGRIAISGEGGGGSGRIEWRRTGQELEVSLQAPVSRQSWRLLDGPQGARLEGLEGGTRSGPDADRLLREALGWHLPLDSIEAWARGGRAGRSGAVEFDGEGRPSHLRESGWVIEYRDWVGDGFGLPRRVFAQSGRHRLRLVVDRWRAPPEA